MIHMTIQQLSSYLDAGLGSDSMERVGIHLSSCAECTAKFVALEQQADRLAEALRHDPGDLLSERFEQAVDERIVNGKRMAAPRAPVARDLPPLPDAPPPPSVGEPVLEESNGGRDSRPAAAPAWSITTPQRREEDPSRARLIAIAAIVLVVVVAAGGGFFAFRSGLIPSWASTMPPDRPPVAPATQSAEPTQPAAPSTPAPMSPGWAVVPGAPSQQATGSPVPPQADQALASRSTPAGEEPFDAEGALGDGAPESPPPASERAPAQGSAIETVRAEELLPQQVFGATTPEPTAPSPDPSRSLPPVPEAPGSGSTGTPSRTASTPMEAAQQMSERAASDPSAATYEAAAKAWEAALGSLHGDAYQSGRWHIAETRYRAWQMDAEDAQRASRANAAIRAFLIAAPPGAEREQARTWLRTIRDSGFRYVESPR